MDNPQSKFKAVYDQFVDKIYRFVFLKVNSAEMAEDIVSEAFTRYWESVKKGKDIENHSAFLYRIARNLVVDYYRQKGKMPAFGLDDLPIIDTRADLVSQSFDSSDMELIKKGLARLNSDYQDVIILHYIEDMAVSEIAANLEKSEGAVRVMLHRALASLRGEVEKALPVEAKEA